MPAMLSLQPGRSFADCIRQHYHGIYQGRETLKTYMQVLNRTLLATGVERGWAPADRAMPHPVETTATLETSTASTSATLWPAANRFMAAHGDTVTKIDYFLLIR